MKLDDIGKYNNNRFLINALKLYIDGNSDYNHLIIVGHNYNKYLEIIYNMDNSIKLISNIYKIKANDFNSKLIIGISNNNELNKYYNACIDKRAYQIITRLENSLKLYIQE